MTKNLITKQLKNTITDDMIRVNQAGEFGAQRIYDGQLAVLKNDSQ